MHRRKEKMQTYHRAKEAEKTRRELESIINAQDEEDRSVADEDDK